MYCPRCGQQQVSGKLKFCNKCGMPLSIVAEVVSNGGSLPRLEELLKGKGSFWTRRNGMIISLFWFLFFVLIVTPFWGILEVEEFAAMAAVTGVFGSLMIFLFSLFFLGKAPKKDAAQFGSADSAHSIASGQAYGQALPPQRDFPVHDYASPAPGSWRTPETGDLAQPGSVTEGTTRLLQKEDPEE